jgi:hypothetical protein
MIKEVFSSQSLQEGLLVRDLAKNEDHFFHMEEVEAFSSDP